MNLNPNDPNTGAPPLQEELSHPRVAAARAGTNPALVCKLPSGWVFLCDMQFLRGYVILMADPLVASLNDLDPPQRAIFLEDMSRVGDALLEVTGAYRINYAIAGNSDPVLHCHIVPRYAAEPEHLRKGLPWSYPPEQIERERFDPHRDHELIQKIARALNKRL
jgi:diadenosine tetraphosphate (Ap4A) HIT family hydrolase